MNGAASSEFEREVSDHEPQRRVAAHEARAVADRVAIDSPPWCAGGGSRERRDRRDHGEEADGVDRERALEAAEADDDARPARGR